MLVHIDEVSKKIGEQSRLQSLVESFTFQAYWWDTHDPWLHTWTTTTTHFIKLFGGRKLSKHVDIPIFKPSSTQWLAFINGRMNGREWNIDMN